MASFTDAISTFNPYVSQLPVIEEMTKLGVEKQAKYDQGIQKIQGQIDNVAGMDVYRNVDKSVLQSKLTQLGSDLKKVAASDFSNFQLVNSVGGMATQIIKDPIIQAAVSSTANIRAQEKEMEAERKKGTLTPDNLYVYQSKLSNYANSTDIKDAQGNPVIFSGKYTPHFDVFKFAKETFNEVAPDGMTWDQVYETNPDGSIRHEKIQVKDKSGKIQIVEGPPIYSPVLIRMEKEGRFPQKVKETLNQIFSDPRVSQQLGITGQYNYRGYTPEMLSQKILNQKETLLGSYNDNMAQLVLEKNTGRKDAQKDIDDLQKIINDATANYDAYAQSAFDNPDGIKSSLYSDEVKNRYATMFGKSTIKQTTQDNPGWNANFKLQQEANDASEFAQTMRQRKLEHQDATNQWAATYAQKEREIASKAKPKGITDLSPELADQKADIDVIHTLDNNYDNAASNFSNASDGFLWQTIFSKIPSNITKFNDLTSKGKSKEEAISTLINNAAAASGETPAAYKSRWGITATEALQKLTPEELNAPELQDAYGIYKRAKKDFNNISLIKKKVDDATASLLGSEVSKAISTKDIKPVTGIINGKEITVTPDDFYDLAVYMRGNKSSLGFLNDEGARQAAKSAAERLTARGKDALLDQAIRQQGAPDGFFKNPITSTVRKFSAPNLVLGPILSTAYGVGKGPDLSQVKNIFNVLNNVEYEKGLKTKADIIKANYSIRPNLKFAIITGDAETDRKTVADLKRLGGAYSTGQKKNYSSDLTEFMTSLGVDAKDINVEARTIIGANNTPMVEIVSYGKEGRLGGMVIQPDEAKNMGIDINKLYEPNEVSSVRNMMQFNNGQTSAGDPAETSTYVSGDAYFEKDAFRQLKNTNYDMKANIKFANGLYYSYIYASDGTKRKVYRGEGSDNLTDVITNLQQNASPAWIQAILNKK